MCDDPLRAVQLGKSLFTTRQGNNQQDCPRLREVGHSDSRCRNHRSQGPQRSKIAPQVKEVATCDLANEECLLKRRVSIQESAEPPGVSRHASGPAMVGSVCQNESMPGRSCLFMVGGSNSIVGDDLGLFTASESTEGCQSNCSERKQGKRGRFWDQRRNGGDDWGVGLVLVSKAVQSDH